MENKYKFTSTRYDCGSRREDDVCISFSEEVVKIEIFRESLDGEKSQYADEITLQRDVFDRIFKIIEAQELLEGWYG